ncbi:MAG TPA: hypothetical protein VK892_14260 [Pyrinomonadaceae bacterium]|nr:hypothetical protein [Pyrinomonadaceae bacterium]
MSDQISNDILKDNVLLVGQSPENPNNQVILDVKKNAEGGFGIFEQRPAGNTLTASNSGEFMVGGWGDFASGEEALKVLSGYLDTHPFYSDYKFSLGEIGSENYSDEDISDGGETVVRAKRGGIENDSSIENGERTETVSPENNRLENFKENTIDDSPAQNNLERADKTEPDQERSKEGLDWEIAGKSFGKSLAIGAGMVAIGGVLVAAGVVSVPVLLGVGLGAGIISLFENANEAKDASAEVSLSKALTKTVSGIVPGDPVTLLEVGFNYNYMTEQEMTQQERSEKAGSIGGNLLSGGAAAGVVKGIKVNKGNKKNQKSQKENKSPKEVRQGIEESRGTLYEDGVDPYIFGIKKLEREIWASIQLHHSIPQFLFRRLKAKYLRSFIHEVGALPIDVKFHRKIHEELDMILRDQGFMKNKKPYLTKKEFNMALQLIEEFYAQKSINYPRKKEFNKLRDAVRTFRVTLESANLL